LHRWKRPGTVHHVARDIIKDQRVNQSVNVVKPESLQQWNKLQVALLALPEVTLRPLLLGTVLNVLLGSIRAPQVYPSVLIVMLARKLHRRVLRAVQVVISSIQT
jgi:hypothetical protein